MGFFSVVLGAALLLSACAPQKNKKEFIFSCTDNPCRELKEEKFPLRTIMVSYNGSALGKILPLEARTTPARALYALLEHGNSNDAYSWRLGEEADDIKYSGYIEVFPIEDKRGAICRKFIQSIALYSDESKTHRYKAHGESCKRGFGSWVIVKEIQLPK